MDASSQSSPGEQPRLPFSEALRKRSAHDGEVSGSPPEKGAHNKSVDMTEDDELEATIRALPSWRDQLSTRGYIVGEKPRTLRSLLCRELYCACN